MRSTCGRVSLLSKHIAEPAALDLAAGDVRQHHTRPGKVSCPAQGEPAGCVSCGSALSRSTTACANCRTCFNGLPTTLCPVAVASVNCSGFASQIVSRCQSLISRISSPLPG